MPNTLRSIVVSLALSWILAGKVSAQTDAPPDPPPAPAWMSIKDGTCPASLPDRDTGQPVPVKTEPGAVCTVGQAKRKTGILEAKSAAEARAMRDAYVILKKQGKSFERLGSQLLRMESSAETVMVLVASWPLPLPPGGEVAPAAPPPSKPESR